MVPSISASASVNPKQGYFDDNNASPNGLSETPQQLFIGRGNLYGFDIEENGGADVFVQFFDAADPGDITVGTTPPDWSMRVPATGKFARDPSDTPLKFFSKGCVVACTSGRATADAPAATPTSTFWYFNMKQFG